MLRAKITFYNAFMLPYIGPMPVFMHPMKINEANFCFATYRVEIQIGVDLLIIGNKWLIITGFIYKFKGSN